MRGSGHIRPIDAPGFVFAQLLGSRRRNHSDELVGRRSGSKIKGHQLLPVASHHTLRLLPVGRTLASSWNLVIHKRPDHVIRLRIGHRTLARRAQLLKLGRRRPQT